MNKAVGAIIFAVGSTISFFVGYKIADNKAKKAHIEDLVVTRNYYDGLLKKQKEENQKEVEKAIAENAVPFDVEIPNPAKEPEEPVEVTNKRFEIVTEDDFDASDEYYTLTFYKNNVISNMPNRPPLKGSDDISEALGAEVATLLTEGKENYVYVRDTRADVCYEIVRSEREYEN